VRDYGQYCPIARSSELLAERWTLIIVRNLLNGCRTFTEIRQGAPGISTALLTQRLGSLERYGVVERTANKAGRGGTYRLTEMGQDLRAICDALGQWGATWLEIEPRHLDPAYVLWATTKLVDVDKIPRTTTVVRFALSDQPSQAYWLVLRRP
jgi:DNA-binding HxlR family transcriptional regulator